VKVKRLAVLVALPLLLPDLAFGVRLKDITRLNGVRSNQLIGYGLVVGLNGTGDKQGTEFTIQSLANMLLKMGIQVDPNQVKVKNVGAVVVTAELPPFISPGMKVDVIVSSIGDAKSLQGGMLLLTPLKGVDGMVYALAQGPVSLGGFSASAGGEKAEKNHATAGRIPEGAIVERGVPIPMEIRQHLEFDLRIPDFTTAVSLADSINERVKKKVAHTNSARAITVDVPLEYQERVADFLAMIENVETQVDVPARVVMNERTGTVVMGENVRISTVAVSHGGLSVVIKEEHKVSQPQPFSQGKTVVVPEKELAVEEKEARLMVLPKSVSLGEVVKALNVVGVTPRDLIAILQAMKEAGALNADLVMM
jgi:flagellar P-ring protein precursor FlgI